MGRGTVVGTGRDRGRGQDGNGDGNVDGSEDSSGYGNGDEDNANLKEDRTGRAEERQKSPR